MKLELKTDKTEQYTLRIPKYLADWLKQQSDKHDISSIQSTILQILEIAHKENDK